MSLRDLLNSSEFNNAASRAPRLVEKLKTALDSHENYEAHQILRTINFRFLRSNDNLKDLVKLLYLGTVYLIREGEDTSGQDLATLFVEASAKALQHHRQVADSTELNPEEDRLLEFHKSHRTLEFNISQMVAKVVVMLPKTELGQRRFLADVFKNLDARIIHPWILHDTIAREFCCNDQHANARYHFVLSANIENAEDIAKFIINHHANQGNQQEVDMFITQFILHYLFNQSPLDQVPRQQVCRQQKESLGGARTRSQIKSVATKIFTYYCENHPQLQKNESMTAVNTAFPLLNFLSFLIQIIDTEEVSTFNNIMKIYAPVLKKDPFYKDYLAKIGTVYFGLPNPNAERSGFLSNIMQMFNATAEEDEDDYDDLE